VAQRIDTALEVPMTVSATDLVIGASVGIAFPEGGDLTLEDILRHADVAMYRAKRAGKGRWTVFDQGMGVEARRRLDMTTALRAAIANRELFLRYHPIFHLESGEIVGFEALARWQHRTLGELLPAQFLPVAEEANLGQPLGRWVLAEACAEAKRWNEAVPDRRPVAVHVNLSVVQLIDPGFVPYVAYILGESRMDPGQLVVEINEDGMSRSDLGLCDRVRDLKTLGVRLAIDDFGTGSSSLARLPELPLDFLKLDGTFVQALGTSSPRATVTRAVLGLAESLGVETVAEGIEISEQLDALKALGCPLGQGYHLAPVVSATEARRLLVEQVIRPAR
jgi:EAL domain-containing protein (putative c-di-GMP-specific phosphodiesterase class I)